MDWRGGRSWAGHIWAGGGDLRAQAGRGWTDPVRGGETPLESRSRLVGAQLSLPRGDGGKKGGRRGEGQKLLTTTPLLLPMSTLGRVWGEI